ncbi:restriction endonuclease subunit S [Flavobacterium sp.]|jgi:type I restriction enzyme S subunit|uniref:restriction endonuclease subunit S n=1 Tax=Flavobacterium sp. TaxID=239 RepID=UPI0037BF6366
MPKNWKTYKLSDALEIKYGKDHKKVQDGNIPIYGTGGVMRYGNQALYDKETILIPRKGSLNNIYYLNEPFWSVDTIFWSKINEDVAFPKYLYYNLKVLDFASMDVGSAIPSLTTELLKKIEIELPSLIEQKSIASILSTIDDKIENNLAINKTLEEMATALYKHWFLDSATDDWEKFYLKDIIEIKGGFSYKGEFIGEGDSLLLGMGCVSYNKRFVSSGARLYSGECNLSHYVEPGEIVLATRQQSDNLPILGKPAIIPKYLLGKKIIVGTNLYRVINKSKLSNSLLFQLLKSKEYSEHVRANASGTTVRMITKDVIELYELELPPEHLIYKYNEKISSISENIEQNTIENITLTQLRDTLLPKLISGEVRLKEFRE